MVAHQWKRQCSNLEILIKSNKKYNILPVYIIDGYIYKIDSEV